VIALWWNRFWFAPGSPVNLAAARIVFAVHALWVLLSRDLAFSSDLPASFWVHATWSHRWRYLLFPGHGDLEYALQAVAAVALVGMAIGYRPRITGLLAALLLYHLAPLESIISNTNPMERGFTISILALSVLALSPCADAWSVSNRGRVPRVERPAWEYHWPLVLVQLFLAQVYLFAGYSKLYLVGWDWMMPEQVRYWQLYFSQIDQDIVFRGVAAYIAERPLLCGLVGVGAVAFDLSFISVLFWKRSRIVIIPLAVLFHAGILLANNIFFINLPQLLIFVDWDWLANRLARRAAPVAAGELSVELH